MRVTHLTKEEVCFIDDNGAPIARIEVTKFPMLVNGYDVKLVIQRASPDAEEEIRRTAISRA